jgi:chromosome segregation ATPase
MSDDMRQEFNGLKTSVCALETRVGNLETSVNGLKTSVCALEMRVGSLETSVNGLKTTVRSLVITVSGHTEALARVEIQLAKNSGTLDRIVNAIESFSAEIIAARRERTLMGKSFFDQQETLTDHELRLTRLETRKPS